MDFREILASDSDDELKKAKLWLFQENVRLENEKKEFKERQDKLIKERAQFRKEMDELNRRMVIERKRLKDDTLFFDKKLQILQDGFRQLEMDKKIFEKDKLQFESERRTSNNYYFDKDEDSIAAKILFSGADNSLALRKRYRDLIKIFHPDNLCGDAKIIQIVNREYEKKRIE